MRAWLTPFLPIPTVLQENSVTVNTPQVTPLGSPGPSQPSHHTSSLSDIMSVKEPKTDFAPHQALHWVFSQSKTLSRETQKRKGTQGRTEEDMSPKWKDGLQT